MLEFGPENMQHACESGDREAQVFAFWIHCRAGTSAARSGDKEAAEASCRSLETMIDLFNGQQIAYRAAAAIIQIDAVLTGNGLNEAGNKSLPLSG